MTNVIDGIQCKFSTIDITQDSGGAVYQLFWPRKTSQHTQKISQLCRDKIAELMARKDSKKNAEMSHQHVTSELAYELREF